MSWLNRILVVRPDRIGDVVLSTPVFDAIKKKVPDSKITVLVREQVAPLLKSHPSVDEIIIYDPDGRHKGWTGIQMLSRDLGLGCFGTALVLQSQWRVALAIMLAGIPHRIGPKSKLHSYFLYNLSIRQNRSKSDRNEADYGLELASAVWEGATPTRQEFPSHLELSPAVRASSRDWLQSKGWKEGEKLVAIHPGMGGSALNWPEKNYIELAEQISAKGVRVLLSFGPMDLELAKRIEARLKEKKVTPIIYSSGNGQDSIDFLAALFSWALVVVAPSTGPLHIAAALGRPVVTFYSPIQVQSSKRWGPFVRDSGKVHVLSPEVACGQVFSCIKERCPHFFCMDRLTVKHALDEVIRYL